MSDKNKIQLKVSSIKNVPLQTYRDEFCFIVNGKEYKTSRILSDLLSSKISKIHMNDPTFDHFTINTKHEGDFSRILHLKDFSELSFFEDELEFFIEVIKILGIDSFKFTKVDETTELTNDNVFNLIKKHEKHDEFYFVDLNREIEYLSSHLYELFDTHESEITNLSYNTLSRVFSSEKLQLQNEDQLVNFLNKINSKDKKFFDLYENVIFTNVTKTCMKEFVETIDFNDINHSLWSSLSQRLCEDIFKEDHSDSNRYKINIKTFWYEEGKDLNGIINYLTKKAGGNLHDKGVIEMSSNYCEGSDYHAKNLLDFNNSNYFSTGCRNNDAWVCFDFKNLQISISKYTIKSSTINWPNQGHLKNWVAEISSDGENWTRIDEQSNCSELNKKGASKTFGVNQQKFARYFRICNISDYWGISGWYLRLNSIELYGQLIE